MGFCYGIFHLAWVWARVWASVILGFGPGLGLEFRLGFEL